MSAEPHTSGVAEALRANAFPRTGCAFADWSTRTNGSGTAYNKPREDHDRRLPFLLRPLARRLTR